MRCDLKRVVLGINAIPTTPPLFRPHHTETEHAARGFERGARDIEQVSDTQISPVGTSAIEFAATMQNVVSSQFAQRVAKGFHDQLRSARRSKAERRLVLKLISLLYLSTF